MEIVACSNVVVSLFAEPDAKLFEESVKRAIAQIEESPFMKRTEIASAEQYFQVSAACCIGRLHFLT